MNRLQQMLKSIREHRLLQPQKLKGYLSHIDKLAYLIIAYFILTVQDRSLKHAYFEFRFYFFQNL